MRMHDMNEMMTKLAGNQPQTARAQTAQAKSARAQTAMAKSAARDCDLVVLSCSGGFYDFAIVVR